MKRVMLAGVVALALVSACTGDDGVNGAAGPPGAVGPAGATGPSGAKGESAANGGGDGGGAAPATEEAVLPGNAFFPESITSDSAGRLYVSSAGNGSVFTVSADGRTVTQLLAPEIVSVTPFVAIAKLGVLVDDARKDLYVCTLNTQTFASTVRRYDLATGTQKASFPLASAGGVCNDLALDAKGNLYVTDSFFGVERLSAGGAALEVWKDDPLLTAGQGQFAADGIVIDGSDVYVNNLTTGALVRIPMAADGTAQAPVAIAVKSSAGAPVSLAGPDGMRLLGAHTLLVAESGADAVSEVKIDPATNTAVRETFASRIDRPSSLVVTGGAAWISEGQIARLFGLESTAVNYPFYVKRVPLH